MNPIFKNTKLIESAEKKFNVYIYQDTNYSDQSPDFYRFYVCKDKNSAPMGAIIRMKGEFTDVSVRGFDGKYSKNKVLTSIATFLNK